MTSYTNVFGGNVIQTSERSLNQVVLNENKTLAWLTQFQDSQLIVAMIVDVTGQDQDDRILTLPDATLTSVGQSILINNIGNHRFILHRNDGTTLVGDFATSESRLFYLHSNSPDALPSPQGGDWREGLNNGHISVTSVGLDVPDVIDAANLVVTNSPITANGNIHLALAGDLKGLVDFGGNLGFAAKTAEFTWFARKITGTANQIAVDNQDGVDGDPVISLPSSIVLDGNITLGVNPKLIISGNTTTIASAGGNVDINLSPSGITGGVVIKGEPGTSKALKFQHNDSGFYNSFKAGDLTGPLKTLLWPASDPEANQIMRISGDGVSFEWSSAPLLPGVTVNHTLPRYIGVAGELGSTGIQVNDTNDMTLVKSISVSTNTVLEGLAIGVAAPDTISSYNGKDIRLFPNGVGRTLATGIAFAWVSYDIDTTSILASYNVSSVDVQAPGQYLINFTHPFSNVMYCAIASVNTVGGNNRIIAVTANKSTTDINVLTYDTDGNLSAANRFDCVLYQILT